MHVKYYCLFGNNIIYVFMFELPLITIYIILRWRSQSFYKSFEVISNIANDLMHVKAKKNKHNNFNNDLPIFFVYEYIYKSYLILYSYNCVRKSIKKK